MRAFVPGELGVADVGGVEDRLHRQQRKWREHRQLVAREARFPQAAPLREKPVCALEHRQLGERLLVRGARGALHPVESLLDGGEIGERQLELDHLAIAHRIDRRP